MLQHTLATLAYRTRVALEGAPPGFGSFDAGAGSRTPHALLHHMSAVVRRAADALDGRETVAAEPIVDFEVEAKGFYAQLARLSRVLSEHQTTSSELAERLIQGPLSDAMTHVGQIALLRRLAGSPIARQDYSRASISVDDLDAG